MSLLRITSTIIALFLATFADFASAKDLAPSLGSSKKTQFNQIYTLIPFTKPSDLLTCSQILDEERLFNEVFSCFKKSFQAKAVTKGEITKPKPSQCKILTKKSPDLNVNSNYNFISDTIISSDKILGFYISEQKLLILASNELNILEDVYKHEIIHYLLDLYSNSPDASHSEPPFTECSSQTFDPKKYLK